MTGRLFSGGVGLDNIDDGLPEVPSTLGSVEGALPRQTGDMIAQSAATGTRSVFVGSGGTDSVADSLEGNQAAASQTFSYSYAPASGAAAPSGSTTGAREARPVTDRGAIREQSGPAPGGGAAMDGSRIADPAARRLSGTTSAGAGGFKDAPAGPAGTSTVDPIPAAQPAPSGPAAAGAPDHPARSSVLAGGGTPYALSIRDYLLTRSLAPLLLRSDPGARAYHGALPDIFPLSVRNPLDAGGAADQAQAKGTAAAVEVPLVLRPMSEEMLDPTLSIYLSRPTGLNTRLQLALDRLASVSGTEIVSLGVLGIALVGLADLWRRRRKA